MGIVLARCYRSLECCRRADAPTGRADKGGLGEGETKEELRSAERDSGSTKNR
jgi:hypothetical protein